MERVTHDTIPPFYNFDSNILILGSIPSKKSREKEFYYMSPQNRFWSVLSAIYNEKIIDRKEFLKKHQIALWDVLYSCDIINSSDATIKNGVPCDIKIILKNSKVKKIFTVGKVAEKYYQKYIYPNLKKESICLPSTSNANCQMSLLTLVKEWSIIKNEE